MLDHYLTSSVEADPKTPQFPQVIDNTMLSDWRACPHRFFRRHLQGLTKGRTNTHLHFGGCFASALEVVRMARCGWFRAADGCWERSSPDDMSDAVKLGCEEFIRAWGDFTIPDFATLSEKNKNLAAGLLAIQSYFREWPLDDPTTIHVHNNRPCVEFSFSLPIPTTKHPSTGLEIVYCGRFDAIEREGRTLYGLDDKTTSSLGDHWRNQWKLRSQFTGYCWGAREYGVNLDGFIVRGTAILKASIAHDEVRVSRPPWHVDRWFAQLKADVRQMCFQWDVMQTRLEAGQAIEALDLSHPYRRNLDHACSDFSGCEFLDLCGSEHPDVWLDDYQVDRWNPLMRTSA